MRIKKDGTVFRIELETGPSDFETRVSFAVNSHGQMARPRLEVSRGELVNMVMEGLQQLSATDFYNWNWGISNKRMPTLMALYFDQVSQNPELLDVAVETDCRFLYSAPEVRELSERTHAVQYNPNCPDPFLVRLVGKGSGLIDHKPPGETKDLLGRGKTLGEAAKNALTQVK